MSSAVLSLARDLDGPAYRALIENRGHTGVLRPYRGRDGRSYYTHRRADGREEVRITNAPATLPRDSWLAIDDAVVGVLVERLEAFADLRAAVSAFNLPNGLGNTVLHNQTASDMRPATISMGPERRGESDRIEYDSVLMPLPVVHKDFDIPTREMLALENAGMPLDVQPAEVAARKVAEAIEHLYAGTTVLPDGTHVAVADPFTAYGGSVFGWLNFPNRLEDATLTAPTGSNNEVVIAELIALRQLLYDARHRGPFNLYMNTQWGGWLDLDYSAVKGDGTLRQRIEALPDIQKVTILDSLPETNFYYVLQEMSSLAVRPIVGMEVDVVQWESLGGYMNHFKVIGLLLAQLRADSNGNSGTAVGRTA